MAKAYGCRPSDLIFGPLERWYLDFAAFEEGTGREKVETDKAQSTAHLETLKRRYGR